MVEIKALKRVISHAKEPVPLLCFLDEVLRGTNTVERIAASSQILKSLTRGNVICFCATHDIELTSILEKQFDNYHFEEEIKDKDILFSYHLYQGKAITRNAIMLLQVIGYDAEIIQAANAMAKDFVETGKWQ